MKKKILATAVSTAIMGGLGAAQTASADAVFAPLFSTQDGFRTFVSIVTKGDRDGQNAETNTLIPTHWIYLFKDINVPGNACTHSDGFGSQTPNDLGTFSLFDGATIEFAGDDTSEAFYISPGFAGMLLVANRDPADRNTSSVSESSIAGEVILADSNNGNVLSYRMINDPIETEEADFDDITYGAVGSVVTVNDNEGQGLDFEDSEFDRVPAAPLTLWHPGLTTVWYLMAARFDMFDPTVPNLTLTVSFAANRIADLDDVPESPEVDGEVPEADPNQDDRFWPTLQQLAALYPIGFFYDRNENLISTSQRFTFNCITTAELSDFIDPGRLTQAETTGGWAHVNITNKPALNIVDDDGNALNVGDPNLGLLLYKLESATGAPPAIFTSGNRIDF